jgi:hypothetical protein
MRVLHAAVFANGQAFASGLQLLGANIWFLARLQALSSRLVGCGHGAVALHIFFDFLVAVLGMRHGQHGAEGQDAKAVEDGSPLSRG